MLVGVPICNGGPGTDTVRCTEAAVGATGRSRLCGQVVCSQQTVTSAMLVTPVFVIHGVPLTCKTLW